MGVLADWQIEQEVKIEPMAPMEKRPGKISYGVGSYGYDPRLGYRFKIPTPHKCTGGVIDPKVPDPAAYEELDLTPPVCHDWKDELSIVKPQTVIDRYCRRCGVLEKRRAEYAESFRLEQDEKCFAKTKPNYIVIPPGSLVLGETVETFEIPRSVLVICVGKSSYARCGLVCNVTPLEPEWRGKVTMELSNTSPMPIKVYCGEGIAQFVFLRGEKECRTSYADKAGRYQNQTGVELSRADGEVKGG